MASTGTSSKQIGVHDFAIKYKDTLLRALDTIDLGNVAVAIEVLSEARASGRTIFVCGNGGTASTASHFSADLAKGASFQPQSRFRLHARTDSFPITPPYSHHVRFQ